MLFSLAHASAETDYLDASPTYWDAFAKFQTKYGRVYDSLDEVKERFKVFIGNLKEIALHNSDPSQNFTMSVGPFSDLTHEEFKDMYTGGFSTNVMALSGEEGKTGCTPITTVNSGLPESIDWREKGAVTSVKNQGQCGSCWAFSATAALEGAHAIDSGELIDLSEQQIVDCAGIAYGNLGCHGGLPDGGFEWVRDNGLCSYDSYPYTSGTTKKAGSCEADCMSIVTISGCGDVEPDNQMVLKSTVATMGPVSVAIEADTAYFQSYSSGVITGAKCGTNLDHAVLVVGYGEEEGQKYWLVKNSWGTDWGENGYVRIAREESTNDIGTCGIAAQPSIPII